jgi:hypothetical protein
MSALCVLDGGDPGNFFAADLFCSKPASANATTPTSRRTGHAARQMLVIGEPASHQFAAALWTVSLNHKAHAPKDFL